MNKKIAFYAPPFPGMKSYYEMIDEKSVVIGEDRFYSILTENPFEFGEKWRDNKLYILQ